ncbi:UBX-domain-containing protein [Hesseltinella vesiculosa]|uniref:UBX-domain-containing protein n=1 Tax=Hesseltinella vesiculosa TaxID=101127 RepID=A0A1X2G5Q4_9FUNG|nr:UBX-domain-containing protein [Hesseltinella vesiculosa]
MADPTSELDGQQTELLQQFQSITQTDDLATAVALLTKNSWKLERSIQNFYDDTTRQAASSTSSPPPRPATPSPASPPRQQRRSGLMSLILWPFGLAWNITWSILTLLNRLVSSRHITNGSSTSSRQDPRSSANRFLREFEKLYGESHPPFYQEGYTQALEQAKRDLQFLLVILQSDEHDDTKPFCENTLTSDDLHSFIQTKNILVWAGNVNQVEAYQVSCTLQASTYPFMAVIALQSVGSSQKMTVVDRLEGPIAPEPLMERLDTIMQRHGAALNRLKQEREHREMERQLREDQDRAYRESLLADQEKDRRAEEERREQEQLREQERLAQEERDRIKQKRKEYIQSLCHSLPKEPSSEEQGKVIKINFRLANGERVIRAFREKETLETLYQFVEAYPFLSQQPSKISPPDDYEHEYRFTLHSPFPRTVYDVTQDGTKHLAEIRSLWPSATLIVDEAAEDDDDQ